MWFRLLQQNQANGAAPTGLACVSIPRRPLRLLVCRARDSPRRVRPPWSRDGAPLLLLLLAGYGARPLISASLVGSKLEQEEDKKY
jgi:hypothetical protein